MLSNTQLSNGLLAIILTLLPIVINAQSECKEIKTKVIPDLIESRIKFDTLLTQEEKNRIDLVRENYLMPFSNTISIYELVDAKHVYYEVLHILNNHKKRLKAYSNQCDKTFPIVYDTTEKCIADNSEDQLNRIKFLTSPLPFLLLLDESFRSHL